MTISCITRWAGANAALLNGKTVLDVDDLNREASLIIDRIPTAPTATPERRQGYSSITHVGSRTGKEILAANIDPWARLLADAPVIDEDDEIPF